MLIVSYLFFPVALVVQGEEVDGRLAALGHGLRGGHQGQVDGQVGGRGRGGPARPSQRVRAGQALGRGSIKLLNDLRRRTLSSSEDNSILPPCSPSPYSALAFWAISAALLSSKPVALETTAVNCSQRESASKEEWPEKGQGQGHFVKVGLSHLWAF